MIELAEVTQGSEAWQMVRCGKVTASRLADVLAKTKSGYSSSRANYMTQLVLERVTGTKAESYTNAAMLHGVTQEPFARAAYEAHTGQMVEEVGFLPHPEIADAGASPDGLVGDDGMVEIKCPSSSTALEVWLAHSQGGNPVDAKYYAQMQWQMRCAGRSWCDYVVFDPRMPAKAQLFIFRVVRNDEWLKIAESEVVTFLAEVDAKVKSLKTIIGE
jgi:putative phage-type endonuclease